MNKILFMSKCFLCQKIVFDVGGVLVQRLREHRSRYSEKAWDVEFESVKNIK